MCVEGALWFPDLLVADPTYALPIILSVTVFTNISWGWKLASIASLADMRRQEVLKQLSLRILRTTLQLMAILLGPVIIQAEAPAGLLIYWISSTLFATAQTQFLSKAMPLKALPQPCRPKTVAVINPELTAAK
jgi:inner membrane protein COX18